MAVGDSAFVALFFSLIRQSMWQWITYAAFGSAVAVDSILAAAVVYYLRRSRGEYES